VSNRTWGILFIALAATSWGTWPLFTHGSPLTGVTIGFITLAVMSLPAPFVFRRADFADRPAAWWLLAVGLADAANVVLYFSALSRGPIVFAVLTHYLAPALVALSAPLILKEPRSRRALIATPLVLAGLTLVLSRTGAEGTDWLTTALLGSGSAVFYALVVIGSRRAGRTFSPLAVTSLHSVVSALALLVVFRGEVFPASFAPALPVLGAALINGLIAAVLFNRALRLIGAQLVGVFTYLEPLTAAVLGVVVFHEAFNAATVAGVVIIVTVGAWAAAEPPQRIAAGDIAEP